MLDGTTGGAGVGGIFRGDGIPANLTRIARGGDAAPDSDGTFSSFVRPTINDLGQAAFVGSLTGTSTGNNIGIFRGDGTPASLTRIVRFGDAAPDGVGTFAGMGDGVALNNAGQVAFTSILNGTGGSNNGIFRGDGSPGSLIQMARAGQAAPDGNGSFSGSFSNFTELFAINDAGQAAFIADITVTTGGGGGGGGGPSTSIERGLFFYDDLLGLLQVAREGDDLLGSTITALNFSSGDLSNGDERSGLNELGQVAYHFDLADGRSGIAVWSVPEPGSLALLVVGGLTLLRRRRA